MRLGGREDGGVASASNATAGERLRESEMGAGERTDIACWSVVAGRRNCGGGQAEYILLGGIEYILCKTV